MFLIRELKIFLFLFILLALLIHFNAWIEHPIEHVKALSHSSLGAWHPFYVVTVIYLLVLLVRWMIKLFKHIGKK